jgi:hypothetical protein
MSLIEYRLFMRQKWPIYHQTKGTRDRMNIVREYGRRLPVHLLARCPFCESVIGEPVDTFSLNGFGWANPGDGRGWAASVEAPVEYVQRCPHVRIVAYYLNLHGKTPDDLFPDKRILAGPAVPSLMEIPMAPEDACAVIHALPVGRFDEEKPQHHYTAYFVSYFTERRQSFITAIEGWGLDHSMVEYQDVDYDLMSWAERGRLLWLDSTDRAFPLRRWGEAHVPDSDIEGDRTPHRTITREGARGPKPRGLARLFRWKWQ